VALLAQSAREAFAVVHVAFPFAVFGAAHAVDRAHLLRGGQQPVDEFRHRDLVRHRDDDAVQIADGLESRDRRCERSRGNPHRHEHGIDAHAPKDVVEHERRACLRDGIADDGEKARIAGDGGIERVGHVGEPGLTGMGRRFADDAMSASISR
jgi:hypothetical protein